MTQNEKQTILYKEIDLIQSCITRMAQNSFIVKGWTVALVVAALALLPEKFDLKILCFISFVLIFSLWYLDAFFLTMEKLFRWKYNWIIKNRPKSDDYILDLNPHNSKMWLKSLDNNKHNDDINELNTAQNNLPLKEPSICRTMFTKTLLPMYGSLALIVIALFVYSFFC